MKTIEAPFYIAGNKRHNTTNQMIFFAVKCSFSCFQTQNTVNPKSVYLLSRKKKQKQTEKETAEF